MRKLGVITTLLVLLFSVCTGCDNSPLDKKVKKEETKRQDKKEGPELTKMSTESFNQSISQGAKKMALSMGEIEQATAVNSNLDLYIAIKPEHHERFTLKSLRSKLKKRLSDEYPTFNVHVSTDRKIFMLLDELENKIQKKRVNKDKIKKQLKLIQTEMESNT
ncbi:MULTISPECIES: YhcN/YlaJ family sporulation lipoprotein [unclassified Bacillus cereus group]|uniref:YhcN/YlaJ family sporulation lipoprotein n=1 Tax=unclassified Bacillus cereus group TaxID=2750818 RepID=UPI001F57578E|nr:MULTISPECIES: YhcN/YlaJ family sporulation lipoprotein [unclassified Bacillus cereus group]